MQSDFIDATEPDRIDWTAMVNTLSHLMYVRARDRFDHETACDVVQETWLRVWRARRAMTGWGPFGFVMRSLAFEIVEESRRMYGHNGRGARRYPKHPPALRHVFEGDAVDRVTPDLVAMARELER